MPVQLVSGACQKCGPAGTNTSHISTRHDMWPESSQQAGDCLQHTCKAARWQGSADQAVSENIVMLKQRQC